VRDVIRWQRALVLRHPLNNGIELAAFVTNKWS
jgi:hypothetical protein